MLDGGILGGTGHRPPKLGGYGVDAFNRIVNVISMYLDSDPPNKVISGLALGFDHALVVAAHNCNIPIIGAVPFEGQEDKWPTASRVAYKYLLSLCSEVVYVSKGGYTTAKMHKRNKWIVDHCNKMVTIYNGDMAGGTHDCIKYANSVGRPVVNLYNIWLKQQ